VAKSVNLLVFTLVTNGNGEKQTCSTRASKCIHTWVTTGCEL